jgi:hypothetical protein
MRSGDIVLTTGEIEYPSTINGNGKINSELLSNYRPHSRALLNVNGELDKKGHNRIYRARGRTTTLSIQSFGEPVIARRPT